MFDPRNDLPLCASRYIAAIDAVCGQGTALELLKISLCLNDHAQIVYVEETGCYFLRVDEFDRWSNRRVGMLEAIATMPFKSLDVFRAEIATWAQEDYANVVDANGLNALIELGLINNR
ncbi:hypothetical protein [Pseudomonas sp.]|jgi:hypothetical protein|uniref:hypothetical protein n=1 Tax=Pseudomonas sp. TaxID=306 RepID=UPI002E30A1F4|nr:hypothetical protein [Pseudomonas sp.]HEX4550434.1 hypothetical protein [Pseudomonas sp.]